MQICPQSITRRAAPVALVVLAALLGGCGSQAKMVRQITTGAERTNQVKMLYNQGNDQGVIKCTAAAADGALSNCKRMTVIFQE
ncbi:MAG: hypothetical protein U0174_16795 [Polyangiaceae bacterium]